MTSAWSLLQQKYREINNKENIQTEIPSTLKEELLKKDEKEN
jgi:hypothetical protein